MSKNIVTVFILLFLMNINIYPQNYADDLEELNIRFSEIDYNNDAEVDVLLRDLNKFTVNKSGFIGGRAWSIIGQIYSAKKMWKEAEDAWFKAAAVASETYLAPIAFFNAAVAAEEQGNLEKAIKLLENSVSHTFAFPAAPRAQFSIGRLNEKLGKFSAALEAYRQVVIKWPYITGWANLAQSRIIAIEIFDSM